MFKRLKTLLLPVAILAATLGVASANAATLPQTRVGGYQPFAAASRQAETPQVPESQQSSAFSWYDTASECSVAAKSVPEGSFSIIDWKGYPANLPKPAGPFRIIEGQEYTAARNAANQANRAMHQADASLAGKQLHEIQPVKFGGEPVNPVNKIPLTPAEHAPATTWWNQLLRDLSGN